MAPRDLVLAHHHRQARQAAAAALLVRRPWRSMSSGDLDSSWAKIVAAITAIVTGGMIGSARSANSYLSELVGAAPDQVDPGAFGLTATDGRPLDSLLYSAVVRTRIHVGKGVPIDEAMRRGGRWLGTLTATQVADAGRGAVSAGIAARPRVGWTRYVSPPCCQRCAVLAGRFFRWNDGFDRHPKCDCVHVPTIWPEPAGYLSEIGPDDVKDLTIAQRRAIDDGADMNAVINQRRGRSSDGMTTSEGTTRRGYASHVRRELARQRGETVAETRQRAGRRSVTRVAPRLTPEAIYRVSATREEAIELLRKNGYLINR